MCVRQGYPPVFYKTPHWPSPFLDDVIGKSMADHLRSLLGFPVVPWGPFGRSCLDDDSYLTSAFSSGWALLAVPLAFSAGLLFIARRRLAWWLIALCAIVPAIDTGARVYAALQREVGHRGAAEFHAVMMYNLPRQMLANLFFQLVLPFVAGLVLERFVSAVERILAAAWSRLAR